MEFIGRATYLERLEHDYGLVAERGEGRFVLIRGRRRVGKSSLVEEFLRRTGAPSVFFVASRQSPERELELFSAALARSGLIENPEVIPPGGFAHWENPLHLIAETARESAPTVVVIDEFPYLVDGRIAVEGTFQKMWDTVLQRAPVLLIVIGSDIAVMDALGAYDRPLHGRPTRTLNVTPFAPTEVQSMLEVDAVTALDAYLLIGGFPLVAGAWRKGLDMWAFLEESLQDPTSPLIVDGERSLAGEFPADALARQVLSAIGSGERTFSSIGHAAAVKQTSLQRALDLLVNRKGVVESTAPLSTRSSRVHRYAVADPYLRFWLRFIAPGLNDIERGGGANVVEQIEKAWPSYRGRAIEPLVRDAIGRLMPDRRFGEARAVGSFWTRGNDVEVDLVLTDRAPRAGRIIAIGSIKWREEAAFGPRDRDRLARLAAAVPGFTDETILFGVSRSGFAGSALEIELGPNDLMAAWPSATSGRRGPP